MSAWGPLLHRCKVRQQPGIRNTGSLTRPEYKEDHGEFIKNKARPYARGDQQIQVNGMNFEETDLYAPALKAAGEE